MELAARAVYRQTNHSITPATTTRTSVRGLTPRGTASCHRRGPSSTRWFGRLIGLMLRSATLFDPVATGVVSHWLTQSGPADCGDDHPELLVGPVERHEPVEQERPNRDRGAKAQKRQQQHVPCAHNDTGIQTFESSYRPNPQTRGPCSESQCPQCACGDVPMSKASSLLRSRR
jgi:hypothetical protein